MAVEIISICDKCGARHKKYIAPGAKRYFGQIDFLCSDCLLQKLREEDKEENSRENNEKIKYHNEEKEVIRDKPKG